ncbi:MAG: hypothetical protein HUJ56_13040 [Erysipelotrichaceae bacterium]|nr:hypothetical protein [Erysipelotrichaceae bacterium]
MGYEVKTCKNKKCGKILPDGYKFNYCEACRNKKIENLKNGATAVVGAVATVGGVVALGGATLIREVLMPKK